MKKLLIASLCIALTMVSIFASGTSETVKDGNSTVVLKMGDNQPDRKHGVGAVIEDMNEKFISENPNVSIETESYNDQPWQEKVRIYATANQLPDIMKYWSLPTLLNPLVDAGMVEELDYDTFAQYNFLPGALESNMIDGKLYGVPASSDFWVIFYNKALFEDAGLEIPTTWEEIKADAAVFNKMGITTMVTDGKDGWPLCEMFDTISERINGDFTYVDDALNRKRSYTDASFVAAADYIQDLIKAGVFAEDLTTSDYGDARNAFGQERAAMYMMGSWEMSLANDTTFSDHFRENLDVMQCPIVEGGKGLASDTLAWYGGNFIIPSTGDNIELSKGYLEQIASDFGQACWDTGSYFPAVEVTSSDKNSDVSVKLLGIITDSTAVSGTPGLDRADNVFKEDHQELMRQLCSLMITSEEFTTKLDASAQLAFDNK
jgi:raffinose/stachyose/melibiose transport system substrate-binding protein